MDLSSYYSESINGFTKNPLLAAPTAVGYVLIYVFTFILTFLWIFGFYGSDILNYSNSTMTSTPDLGAIWILMGIVALIFIITWIITSFIYAATIGMSKKIVLGEKPELDAALKYGKKYLLKILGVYIVEFILSAAASIPLILGIILLITYPGNSLSILGMMIGGLISVLLFIGIFVFFIFTYQSVVVGKNSIIGSFKESYKLVKKNFFDVLVVLIINALIMGTVIFLTFFINLFIGIIPFIGWIISTIISVIIYSITLPYFTLVLNYFYMDMKDMIPDIEQ